MLSFGGRPISHGQRLQERAGHLSQGLARAAVIPAQGRAVRRARAAARRAPRSRAGRAGRRAARRSTPTRCPSPRAKSPTARRRTATSRVMAPTAGRAAEEARHPSAQSRPSPHRCPRSSSSTTSSEAGLRQLLLQPVEPRPRVEGLRGPRRLQRAERRLDAGRPQRHCRRRALRAVRQAGGRSGCPAGELGVEFEGQLGRAARSAGQRRLAGGPGHVAAVPHRRAGKLRRGLLPGHRAAGGTRQAVRRAGRRTCATSSAGSCSIPTRGQLAALEMYPEEDTDPCELYFSEYQEIEGRMLPARIEVRHGDRFRPGLSMQRVHVRTTAAEVADRRPPARAPMARPREPGAAAVRAGGAGLLVRRARQPAATTRLPTRSPRSSPRWSRSTAPAASARSKRIRAAS